jgi:hypothetical protein
VGAANVGVTAASQRLAHAKVETNLTNTIAGYMSENQVFHDETERFGQSIEGC